MVVKRVGGKSKIAKWIAEHTPPCSIFVDALGGSGVVLDTVKKMRGKGGSSKRALRYVYNDSDEKLYHFFKMLQDKPIDLAHLVNLMPYSRKFFNESYEALRNDDLYQELSDLDKAVVFLVINRQSFGAKMDQDWSVTRDGEVNYETWNKLPKFIVDTHRTWKSVFVENVDFTVVVKKWDTPKTVFYLDPPYEGVEEHYYDVNKGEGFDHALMFECLQQIKGSYCVSYYGGVTEDDDSELVRRYADAGCQIFRKKVLKHLSDKKEKESAIEVLLVKQSRWAAENSWTYELASVHSGKKVVMKEIE